MKFWETKYWINWIKFQQHMILNAGYYWAGIWVVVLVMWLFDPYFYKVLN